LKNSPWLRLEKFWKGLEMAMKETKKAGKTLKVRQVASGLGHGKSQIATLRGLGLNKVGREKVLLDTPEIRGMIKKVSHIVEIIEE
jgi:large subunit ribosomal protein L30